MADAATALATGKAGGASAGRSALLMENRGHPAAAWASSPTRFYSALA